MQHLDYTRPIIAILILALLVMAFGWLRSCEKAKELVYDSSKTDLLQKVAEKDAQILAANAQVDSIRKVQGNDALKFARDTEALSASRDYWKGKALQARPQVNVIADSIPVLKEYLLATDSVIENQHATINSMGMRIRAMEVSHLLEVAALGAKNVATVELSKEYAGRVAELESKLRKSERRRKFFRGTTLIMAGAVGILLLAK